MRVFIKDSVQKFLGYIFLIAGVFFLTVGIGMLFDPDRKDRDKAPSIIIFSNAFTIPGIMLIIMGRKNKRLEEQIEHLVTIIKSYRRISMVHLASKLNMSVRSTEKLLSKAVSLNLIEGNIDRTTGEFFTDEGNKQKVEIKFCPSCGAPLNKVFLTGETIKCEMCGVISFER